MLATVMRLFALGIFGFIFFKSDLWIKAGPIDDITRFQALVLFGLFMLIFYAIMGYSEDKGDNL